MPKNLGTSLPHNTINNSLYPISNGINPINNHGNILTNNNITNSKMEIISNIITEHHILEIIIKDMFILNINILIKCRIKILGL